MFSPGSCCWCGKRIYYQEERADWDIFTVDEILLCKECASRIKETITPDVLEAAKKIIAKSFLEELNNGSESV